MAAITASMVGALRAKTDAPMMECKKALTEADGDMDARRGDPARQARQQGRQGGVAHHRRRRRRRRRSTARPARWSRSTARPTSSPRTTRSSPSRKRLRRAGRRRTNPADVAALSALPLQPGRLRPDGRGRAQGPDRQDRREHVDPPLQALRRRRQARQLPARHAHRRAGRVRRRRGRGQGRRDARRGDEAGGAVVGRRAADADRQGALGRDAEGRRGRREGQGRRQAGAVARDRRQARSRARSRSS